MSWYKRLFDILLSFGLIVSLAPLYLAIACVVKSTSGPGSSLVETSRGEKQAILDAEVPEHDDRHAAACYAFVAGSGKLSHSSWRLSTPHKLDELPQLFTIFRGDMTFVGPRPALFNQDDLVSLRYGVWSQLAGSWTYRVGAGQRAR